MAMVLRCMMYKLRRIYLMQPVPTAFMPSLCREVRLILSTTTLAKNLTQVVLAMGLWLRTRQPVALGLITFGPMAQGQSIPFSVLQ